MKNSLSLITGLLFILTSNGIYAAGKTGDKQTGSTEIVVQEKHILGDLKMEDRITITAEMIARGREQTFQIATFCTYTNNKKGKVNVRITNNENKFAMEGTKGEGRIDYTLKIGNKNMKYGANELTVDPTDPPASCKTVETVYMTLDGDSIKNAKAGTYNASFNIAVA